MSNLLFTPPNFLGWSVFKSPQMNTLLQQAAGGKTTRAQLWANPIWNYKLTWEILRDSGSAPTPFKQLIDFFLARGGSFDTFLYTDPNDNAVTGQLLGYGDGSTKTFQLLRNFSNFYEAMQNPNVVSNVYINGVAQAAFSYAIGTENLLLRSQNFTNAAWTPNSATILDNQTTAPDGTATAGKFTQVGTGGSSLVQVAQMSTLGLRYGDQLTFSSYMQQNTAGFKVELRFDFLNASGTTLQSVFGSLQTLTASFSRYSLTATIPIGTAQVQVSYFVPAGQNANGNSFFMWGAQLERWPSATGYLPTTSAIIQPLGIVTFGTAPGAGLAVTADFSYYYRLRFKQDINEFEQFMSNLWALKTLELVSERL